MTNRTSAAGGTGEDSASKLIDAHIGKLGDWRGEVLARVRTLIRQADPEATEDVKWRKPSSPAGVPVWSHPVGRRAGIICTGETYKDKVKLTFARGAELDDPLGLFNAGLKGGARRAIDIHEGDKLNEKAFKALVRAAVALEKASQTPRPRSGGARTSAAGKSAAGPKSRAKPVLLSGGNPQIAKGDGDRPVQAYIAAMPGWKQDVGRWIDAIITREVPEARKAVRWNSPFYGMEGRGWFLSFHCFTKYVKVAFFRGKSLRPMPPDDSRSHDTRYLNIHEDDELDEAQFADWVKQASRLQGWGNV